jgi:hypothetical protein
MGARGNNHADGGTEPRHGWAMKHHVARGLEQGLAQGEASGQMKLAWVEISPPKQFSR